MADSDIQSAAGQRLYALLPREHRTRDANHDLARFLDACGTVFDRLRATLDQLHAGHFPVVDVFDGGGGVAPGPPPRTVQEWLLPYFADLLDVTLCAPTPEGRRREIAQAVRWRQRKGTLACIEEVAEVVGGFEVELQEGTRVSPVHRV